MANLAINGGTPVRTEPYPSWPTFDDWVYETLLDASGKYHQKFFIARIDIEACKNIIKPDLSAAFRSQDRRRFSYDFDDNDMNVNVVVGTTGVQIDYDAKNVKITMTGSLAASRKVSTQERETFLWSSEIRLWIRSRNRFAAFRMLRRFGRLANAARDSKSSR